MPVKGKHHALDGVRGKSAKTTRREGNTHVSRPDFRQGRIW